MVENSNAGSQRVHRQAALNPPHVIHRHQVLLGLGDGDLCANWWYMFTDDWIKNKKAHRHTPGIFFSDHKPDHELNRNLSMLILASSPHLVLPRCLSNMDFMTFFFSVQSAGRFFRRRQVMNNKNTAPFSQPC